MFGDDFWLEDGRVSKFLADIAPYVRHHDHDGDNEYEYSGAEIESITNNFLRDLESHVQMNRASKELFGIRDEINHFVHNQVVEERKRRWGQVKQSFDIAIIRMRGNEREK